MSNEAPNHEELTTLRALAHQVLVIDQEILQVHDRISYLQNNYLRLIAQLKTLQERIERLEEATK